MSVKTRRPCNRCECPGDRIHKTSENSIILLRDTAKISRYRERMCTFKLDLAASEWLKKQCIHPEIPGGALWFGENMAECFVVDPMHAFLLGSCKRIATLIPKLFSVSTEERQIPRGGKKRARDGDIKDPSAYKSTSRKRADGKTVEACKVLFEERVATFGSTSLHSWDSKVRSYLPTFTSAGSVSKNLKASDYKYVIQMLLFVIGTGDDDFFIPEFTVKLRNVLKKCSQIGELIYNKAPWTSRMITELENTMETFGDEFYEVFKDVSESECRFIKTHMLRHLRKIQFYLLSIELQAAMSAGWY
jgi:hypothetical protein